MLKVVTLNAAVCVASLVLCPFVPFLMDPLHATRGGLWPLLLALITTRVRPKP
jgi:hypothetical protein